MRCLRHQPPVSGEDLSSPFSYSPFGWYLKQDHAHQSPISVFQGPVSSSSTSSMRFLLERDGSIRVADSAIVALVADSATVVDTEKFGFSDLVDDLLAILDLLGIDKKVILSKA